jgi:PRC-barrel domain
MTRVRLPELVTVALAAALALALVATPGTSARAQDSNVRPDLTPQMSELMGAPVFAANGPEVGEVSAVAMAGDGIITEVRVTTASALGLGMRTVVLPPGTYVALRGAVVVDLSSAEFDALPTAGRR